MSYIISGPLEAPCCKCSAEIHVACDCAPRGIDYAYLSDAAKERYRLAHEVCSSPIEQMLLEALQLQTFGEEFEFLLGSTSPTADDFGRPAILCVPQCAIPPYIADFVLFDLNRSTREVTYALVVECDGHDFHERTKQQAAYDRYRDRVMQFEGYEVIRFTGSEINADPGRCADQVIAFIKRGIR